MTMGFLAAWLFVASPRLGAAAYHLEVTDSTLVQALHQAHEDYGVDYLVLEPPARRLTDTFEAEDLTKLAQDLGAAYGCELVALPPVLIAAPQEPNAEEPLKTFSAALFNALRQRRPPPWAGENPEDRVDIRPLLKELLREISGGEIPQPNPQADTSIPYRSTEPRMVQAWRAWLLDETAREVQRLPNTLAHLFARPAVLSLRGNQVRLEGKEVGSWPLGEMDLDWEKRLAFRDHGRYGPWFCDLAPRGAQGIAAVLNTPVDVTVAGTAGSFLEAVEKTVQVQIRADPAGVDKRVCVCFRDAPFWVLLDALTLATGRRWSPAVDAERYRLLEAEESWVAEAVALAPLALREELLLALRMDAVGGLRAWLWPTLTEQERAALQAGQRLARASLSARSRHLVDRIIRIINLKALLSRLDEVDFFLRQDIVSGSFLVGRRGDVSVAVALRPDVHTAFWLEWPPNMGMEELKVEQERRAAGPGKAPPPRYASPRWSCQASSLDYGTRAATESRMKVNRQRWGQWVARPED